MFMSLHDASFYTNVVVVVVEIARPLFIGLCFLFPFWPGARRRAVLNQELQSQADLYVSLIVDFVIVHKNLMAMVWSQ